MEPRNTVDQADLQRLRKTDLRVRIFPDHFASYEGTAAQLTAEGLVPDDFAWPAAARGVRWSAGGFDYWLRRVRPEGHKGPMRTWFELDNWEVHVNVTGRDYEWHARRSVQRKAEELQAEIYRHSPAWCREWNAKWRQYEAARSDTGFQAFKALVPGLVPPKRGRKSRGKT